MPAMFEEELGGHCAGVKYTRAEGDKVDPVGPPGHCKDWFLFCLRWGAIVGF